MMILLLLAACRSPETPDPPASRFDEPWRPQVHFTPASGWMNDPVGLVYFLGKYHLFYQHDPDSLSWGPMHWGHATSDDLVRWEHQPVALSPDDALGAAWSGSAYVDETDEMGLCGAAPCLLLAYTLAGETQQIGLATSSDGETFTPYAGNPVIPNPGLPTSATPTCSAGPTGRGAWRSRRAIASASGPPRTCGSGIGSARP